MVLPLGCQCRLQLLYGLPMMHWTKDHQTESFILSLILCCSLSHAVTIRLEDVSDLIIIESEVVTRHVCHDSSIPTSNAVVFSLTAFPVTSDITFPSGNSFTIPVNKACEAIQINSVDNFMKEDTKTFRISLSPTADVQVDENQDHFILHVLDDDTGTSGSCPLPTEPTNGATVSCPSHTVGSECTYQCNSGYEIVAGSFSRRCNDIILRWSETPLFCDQGFNNPPSIVCPNDFSITAISTSVGGVASWDVPTCTDPEDGTITLVAAACTPASPNLFQGIGANSVTCQCADSGGLSEQCTFVITVEVFDDVPPEILNCPEDITVNVPSDSNVAVVTWPEVIAADNSGITPVCTPSVVSGSEFGIGTTSVVINCVDGNNNPAFCNFNVIVDVNNPQPPIIIGCPTTITVVAPSDQQGAVVSWTEPIAEADLGVPTRDRSHAPPAFFSIGKTEVVYTFTDPAGNFATCTFDVIVLDQTPPDIINCPSSPIRASLSPPQTMVTVTFTPPMATDNSQGVINGDCTHNSGDVFPEGSTLVVCEFTDESGNSNLCTFQVIVDGADVVPPVIINCPNDMTREATGPEPVIVGWPPLIVTDNSGIQPTLLSGPPDFQYSFSPGASEIVRYIYSDAANNIAECTFTVTIVAPSAPVVDCSGLDITETAPFNQPGKVIDLPSCSATSSAGTVTQVSQVPSSGSFFPVGITIVVNIFQDSNGLQGSGTFTVTINSGVAPSAPVVDCSGLDITETAPFNQPGKVIDLPSCSATSSAGTVTQVSQVPPSGSFFPVGITIVINIFQDSNGLQGSGTFTVTINLGDDVPPTITNCPTSPIVVYIPIGQMQGEATWIEPMATDLSGEVTVSQTHSSGDNFQLGTTVVTYNFYDTFNNMESCEFNVTITTVGIVCPPPITVSYGDQLSYTTPQCTATHSATLLNTPSLCTPQNGMIAVEDVLGVCTCSIAPHITCTFQVTVTTSVQCPSAMTISPGDMLSYDIPQCMSGQGSSTASCSLSTGSPVTTDTSITCSCPQDGSVQCSFQIFVDCTALNSNFCWNPAVSCDCVNETCNPDTAICSRSCTIVNTCPASIESESLSQVNPSSSVNITCTLRGSTTILETLQLRLSSKLDSLDDDEITRLAGSGVNTVGKVQSTFRVDTVTREKTLYCVLVHGNYLIGGVVVSGFLHELPVLNAAPISEDVSNTSITISWRAWDPDMDDGEPPILAYIPYYRMDASDEWISGPKALTNETLQFKADNLEVDTLYEFSVAVVREGENGEGRRSPSVKVKTLCNVPELAVSVNVQLTSSNKVSVSWQLPNGEIMCSTGVTSYKVYYKIEGSTDGNRQLAGTVEDIDTRWFIVDDGLLQPESSYIFFVTVTTDQESGFRESEPIQVPADTSSPIYLIVTLVIIPVLLIAVIVVFLIVRCHQKNNLRNKKTSKADADFVNADDHEDYISLEEQSRTVSSSKYEDLNHKPQVGVSIPPQYEVTIIPEPQKVEGPPRYHTRNMKGVNNFTYEGLGVSSEKRQLPDVPQPHPSGDEDGEKNYIVPYGLKRYTGVSNNIRAKPVQLGSIKVAEFQKFMRRNKEDVVRDIFHQFMALPSGGQYPWSVALKFQNKPRNFFKTILAYDHSRVKLDTNGSDARSDYINASYIKNQQGKTSFIAAQGPQEGTVDDFWKMVWQENVETIVMVTDNIEKNIKNLRCTYWPNKVHTGEVYGDITVILMEFTSYTSHTIRKLNLLKGNHKAEVHTVTQIHVLSWPYGGVPKEPASLISIIKKVKSLQTDGSSSPLLVHCSNGIGATGTFIAVYVLMDTIKKNKDVNIFDFVKNMRDDRVDMVQTRVQYLFIFECLLAVIQSTDSQISCDQLKKLGHAAIKLKSKKEYKALQESVIEEQHCEDYTGNLPENQHKNRFMNLIPVDSFRPVLKSQGNMFGSNSYISANHLVNFGRRDFIMTQTPLTATVEDFWRLVYDYECTTIVMLNTVGGSDESVVQYWPGGAHGSAQYGLMTVECKSTTKRDSCIHNKFQVAHKKVGEKSVSVDHFVFCGWSGNQPDVSKLRQFIRYTANKNNEPVLVHCINGVGLSAVYVIVKTEGQNLEQEGSADVFQCLTKLRKICPHAIQTQEHYILCYQLLKDHLNNPEDYAVVY